MLKLLVLGLTVILAPSPVQAGYSICLSELGSRYLQCDPGGCGPGDTLVEHYSSPNPSCDSKPVSVPSSCGEAWTGWKELGADHDDYVTGCPKGCFPIQTLRSVTRNVNLGQIQKRYLEQCQGVAWECHDVTTGYRQVVQRMGGRLGTAITIKVPVVEQVCKPPKP